VERGPFRKLGISDTAPTVPAVASNEPPLFIIEGFPAPPGGVAGCGFGASAVFRVGGTDALFEGAVGALVGWAMLKAWFLGALDVSGAFLRNSDDIFGVGSYFFPRA
jgi:hypothetical protein